VLKLLRMTSYPANEKSLASPSSSSTQSYLGTEDVSEDVRAHNRDKQEEAHNSDVQKYTNIEARIRQNYKGDHVLDGVDVDIIALYRAVKNHGGSEYVESVKHKPKDVNNWKHVTPTETAGLWCTSSSTSHIR
jgi:hypothetical protein